VSHISADRLTSMNEKSMNDLLQTCVQVCWVPNVARNHRH
jgi:hypothetical protein